jgi:hypothetical protein
MGKNQDHNYVVTKRDLSDGERAYMVTALPIILMKIFFLFLEERERVQEQRRGKTIKRAKYK